MMYDRLTVGQQIENIGKMKFIIDLDSADLFIKANGRTIPFGEYIEKMVAKAARKEREKRRKYGKSDGNGSAARFRKGTR